MSTIQPPHLAGTARHEVTYLQEEWRAAIRGNKSNDSLAAAWDLEGPFDPDALQAAVAALVDRYESLRTAFDLGPPVRQVVHPAAPVEITNVSLPRDSTALQALIVAEMAAPFELTRSPLWRLRLVRLAPEHHVLLMVAHHLICDGYSFALLEFDLVELYRAAVNQQPARLPPVTMQPRHVAAHERQSRQ
ncbi:MAG TPA: condensation domain-containing protein, partial [Pseudonocardiaceae bacterium]|nr:condensation domain-containing protein [Pseudonocardiaceae bacterium]